MSPGHACLAPRQPPLLTLEHPHCRQAVSYIPFKLTTSHFSLMWPYNLCCSSITSNIQRVVHCKACMDKHGLEHVVPAKSHSENTRGQCAYKQRPTAMKCTQAASKYCTHSLGGLKKLLASCAVLAAKGPLGVTESMWPDGMRLCAFMPRRDTCGRWLSGASPSAPSRSAWPGACGSLDPVLVPAALFPASCRCDGEPGWLPEAASACCTACTND